MEPTGGSVDGAGEARGLDEGLDEHRRGVVALGPILGQTAAHDGDDVRAEVGVSIHGNMRNLGLSTTRGDVRLAQALRPSDEAVARGKLPRAGDEADPPAKALHR